jgi:hypothetical protein
MPKFLTTDEVFAILQRELPDDVYPVGAPSAYYSTADNYGFADGVAAAYANLARIYANFWPLSADERISDWEVTAFGYELSSSLSLDAKRQLVNARMIAKKGTTTADLVAVVKSVIGTDKVVEVAGWGGADGGWILNDNQLGITTIFNSGPRLKAVDPLVCEKGPADFGLTQQEWDWIREEAYTYSVLVYGYTMTAAERVAVDSELLIYELARDQHFIYDGLDPQNAINVDLPRYFGGDATTTSFPLVLDGGSAAFTGASGIDGGGA